MDWVHYGGSVYEKQNYSTYIMKAQMAVIHGVHKTIVPN